MIKEMFDEMEVMFNDLQGRDEIFKGIAKIYKKSYDAMREVGFNHEDAIQILVHQGTSVTAKAN
jgi:hypothetical protein